MSEVAIWAVIIALAFVLIVMSTLGLMRLSPNAYPEGWSFLHTVQVMARRHTWLYILVAPVFVLLCFGSFEPGFNLVIAFGIAVAITYSEASQSFALRERSSAPRPERLKDLMYIGMLFLDWMGYTALLAAIVGLICELAHA